MALTKRHAWVLVAAAAACHYGYKPLSILLHDSEWQRASNWFYALRGVLGVVLGAILLPSFRSAGIWLGVYACWLVIGEEAQTAVCGVAWMGGEQPTVPTLSSLCIVEFGKRAYIVAASAGWATLILWSLDEQQVRSAMRSVGIRLLARAGAVVTTGRRAGLRARAAIQSLVNRLL